MISITNNSSTTTQKLQAFLAGAPATTNPTCTVHSYIVRPDAKTDYSEYRRSPQFTVLAGATETDIADAPTSGTVKDIVQISIYNTDTASVTVTVCIDDNATNRLLIKATLLTLETLHYEDGQGWYATDASGARKTAFGATGQFTTLTVSGNTTLGDAAADSLTINTGVYSAPNMPCFLAYNSATDTNVTGNGAAATVDFDTEVFDQGNNFASDTFTAPTTGKYQLNTTVLITDLSIAAVQYEINIITSNRTYGLQTGGTVQAGLPQWNGMNSVVADMDAGDTATVTVKVAGMVGDTADIFGSGTNNYTRFSGYQAT